MSQADTVAGRLAGAYPDPGYPLDFENALQLLVAAVLAAQATDDRVNTVTPALFKRFPDAAAFAAASVEQISEPVTSISFYRKKAEAIRSLCRQLIDDHGGEVPETMGELVKLPRVARKTANLVLTAAFGKCEGVLIDTHAARVSQRLGLSAAPKPEKIEADIMKDAGRGNWLALSKGLTAHGRAVCTAKNPACEGCTLEGICPKVGVTDANPAKRKTVLPSAGGGELPESWRAAVGEELTEPYFTGLTAFVEQERAEHEVFPPADAVYTAFRLTPFDDVKVVILGQDPYHDNGQAHGLCFSVLPGVGVPPSLRNIYKELKADLGHEPPAHGNLAAWAERGVLMLNTVLTVRAHEANSHRKRGWETFTDAVIRAVNSKSERVVFVLWGTPAQKKAALIDATRHAVVQSAHPSPLSAKKFLGTRPFSQVNERLREAGRPEIDWRLPAEAGVAD